ncbi:kelch-like protein 20 [Glossina fuscipes]|uniref:Kelch-like protein 20 n=1 Tax=Glossina fuscipes TaxID=7396 RepID=A0A9C5ZGU0_9MUSC|nr:kelch-like protein 20 [Glossina fuscipes]
MCEVYDISKNKLVPIANMNQKRFSHSVISLNGVVYAVGGRTNRCYLTSGERYDVYDSWRSIASMNNPRSDFGICTRNDFIYVVGGSNTSTVESYDPSTDKWDRCTNVPTDKHLCVRATVVENSIYTLAHRSSLSFCFRFDPTTTQWHTLNKTHIEDEFQLVSYDSSLFLIENDYCKRLDLRMNKWESIPSLQFERYGFSAVIAADDIYVLGGATSHSAGHDVTSVERFNIRTNAWTTIESMEIEHYKGGAAVVSG